jgi:hypothetical protein
VVLAARAEAVVVAEAGGTVSVRVVRGLSCGVTNFRGSDVIRGSSYVPQPSIPPCEQCDVNRCIIRMIHPRSSPRRLQFAPHVRQRTSSPWHSHLYR